ncbi:Methyltransferase-like protein 4 [Linnemannia exigua]|uniref:Methyltransferase-like protein 4 n=1 Tax=Linnemannia exigua TaxID=604196 RepID=A0AAD4H4A1_9FUNG|nr:Methyltransferase-like protein 4 [Linnemannia exigua]
MSTKVITTTKDAIFIAPVREPVAGWSVRPGTFRVAKPYDKPTISGTQLAATGESTATPAEAARPHKKQKLLPQKSNNDEEITQWIQSALQSLLGKDSTRTHILSIQQDEFYGTYVDAPASEELTLDLVKAQPTLQLLRHGFQSTSSKRRQDQADDDTPVEFDEIELDADYQQQQLEMTDVYETFVANKSSRPAFVTFPTEGQPRYLIPPHSAFVASDFGSIHGLKAMAKQRGGFNVIVMDPPWQNASVDRMGHYGTFDLYELFKIPIPDLLSPNTNSGEQSQGGGVVAVWITNRAKIRKVVVEKLFPAWGLELVAHWYWLKVTTQGEPVLSLDSKHRRPYEGILIGRRKKAQSSPGSPGTAISKEALTETGPKRRLIVSVPSQHSRKPSIMDLVSEEYFQGPRPPNSTQDMSPVKETERRLPGRLELFARTLEEGVLSWGNEPFKYQYCGRGSAPLIQDGYLIPATTSGDSS